MGYSASMQSVEKALEKTMKDFKDDPNVSGKEKIVTDLWNQIQTSVSTFKSCIK